MRRREFITLLGGAAAGPSLWPLAARAQQGDQIRRIGMLMANQTDADGQSRFEAFVQALEKLGWTDGRNVRIEYPSGAGDGDSQRAGAADLVRREPDVVLAASNSGLAALQRLTHAIPIVFVQVSDPVGSGFVESLARPGGNITGVQNYEPAMASKWLELLKAAAPHMRRVGVIFGSNSDANVAFLQTIGAAAPAHEVQVTAIDVLAGSIERVIATFASQRDGGLIVLPHAYTVANRAVIIVLAARYRLPAIYFDRYIAAEGGLMSYSSDVTDQWRRAAGYVDRVLKGEKPAELPIQEPEKFDLVINLKIAKALGFNIPQALLLRANEVIE
jgi:putative ABC transport system substrate-binding protein